MTATKFITFGIGCLLLLPFIWSFVLMVLPPSEPTEEAKAIWEHEKAKMLQESGDQNDPDGMVIGASGMITYRCVTIHERLAGVWLLAPRTWVGVLGIASCATLLLCLFVSSFYHVVDDSFGVEIRVPKPASHEGDALLQSESSDNSWVNPPPANTKRNPE
ncbi:MAG: hypothetical protein IAE77_27710 [Prosthecobacter sp.]|uniref:hypothetical protein n=1 Tax=Prosthecobacter sp. TaxID=1965333 RepID=UPI0019F5E2BA|nr:hypothetical protein [Prosthecobacter sp.]MBE2287272.1 hypothetical protein [Prosthecobacter sp.]